MRPSFAFVFMMVAFSSSAWAQYGDSDIVPNPWGNLGLEEYEADTSGRNDNGAHGPTICVGKRHTDELSERILILLSHYKYCNLFSRSDYGRFLQGVSPDQQYAINYYAWAMKSELLTGAEAKRLEASFFADEPLDRSMENESTSATESALGACGLPYSNDNVRKVQEISAKNGMCDWYHENVGADGG